MQHKHEPRKSRLIYMNRRWRPPELGSLTAVTRLDRNTLSGLIPSELRSFAVLVGSKVS